GRRPPRFRGVKTAASYGSIEESACRRLPGDRFVRCSRETECHRPRVLSLTESRDSSFLVYDRGCAAHGTPSYLPSGGLRPLPNCRFLPVPVAAYPATPPECPASFAVLYRSGSCTPVRPWPPSISARRRCDRCERG